MSSTLKNILIFVLIFAALAGGYYFFVGNKTETSGLTTIDATTGIAISDAGQSGVGSEFLSTLLNIKNIKLDDSIFSNPAFRSLQDFTTDLVDQGNSGRPNPFAPIGADSFVATQTATASATEAGQTATPPKSGKTQP